MPKLKAPFIWDEYSDQPYPLKDKAYKKRMRLKHLWAIVPLLVINIIFFPLAIVLMFFLKGKKEENKSFFAMAVAIDKGHKQVALIEELGVKHLLIRMPLWEMHRIEEYLVFAKSFGEDKEILLNILQDREHIEDKDLLKKDMAIIFEKFGAFVEEYQIGNAINRSKWGFFSMDEYLSWFETIQKVRDTINPKIKLIGSSVIDFEFHYTIRTLFNFFAIKYDRFSSLLYVDRRGKPQNTQMGFFDTKHKINMLYALVWLSSKTTNDIYITEVNWPLKGTAPYAPTSERECVSEEEYKEYMLEYHRIAKESRKIKRIYWHQLIARGYGLVDDKEDEIRKHVSFEAYKSMVLESLG
ncbi:FIG00388565: hypothetical protein [hydrothermal vent metagenome]|uniref:Uncharacterized protein n=1 Tax=hydrothermal vent metagenome TaxID=652676 RepID=A0A1W1C6E1_9ZZZZ